MANLRFAALREPRAACITGGARGLGRSTALRIAEEGRVIALLDVLDEEGEQTVADIEALGEEVKRRVHAHSGVELEWEIQRVGRRRVRRGGGSVPPHAGAGASSGRCRRQGITATD